MRHIHFSPRLCVTEVIGNETNRRDTLRRPLPPCEVGLTKEALDASKEEFKM